MMKIVYADGLDAYPRLAQSMFEDRAAQFRDRLGWDVTVNEKGEERDQYEGETPLYVIATTPDGRHAGSMRFLPTMGRTMVNEVFPHLAGEVIADPKIWECTRFCLAPNAPATTAARLMLAAGELGLASGLTHAVGVFDARMVLIYRRLGWPPEILGTQGDGVDAISLGRWAFSPAVLPRLRAKAGVGAEVARHWVTRSLGPRLAA